nr:5-formyltetrahydrofolate cyclo-ligase [Bacilli bacterium]
MDKATIRQSMRNRRKLLESKEKDTLDQCIAKHLFAAPWMNDCKTMMIYLSSAEEINTDPIIEHAWAKGIQVAVPKTFRDQQGNRFMEAFRITRIDEVTNGAFGIREPKQCDAMHHIDPSVIDVIITPGLAFTRKGDRLGYGGGYYDRYLTQIGEKTVVIGVAYPFQVVEQLPTTAFDHPVDFLLTPEGLLACSLKFR